MKSCLILLLLFVSQYSFAQSNPAEKIVQAGNEFYQLQQFEKASVEYNKAVESDPSNITAKFNQANALYKQDKKVEASKILAVVIKDAVDNQLRSKGFYNKGVILTQQKNLEESIVAYKNALRNEPDDKEARENLQKALLELKKKNEEKKKENDQQKKKKNEPQKQPQSKMNPKEAEQRLKLLQQKEKEVQERVQKEKTKTSGSQPKDW